jgi:hypothetical protein
MWSIYKHFVRTVSGHEQVHSSRLFDSVGRGSLAGRIGQSLLLITAVASGLSQFTRMWPSDRNRESMTAGYVIACSQLDPLFIWAMTVGWQMRAKKSSASRMITKPRH